ncbi:MAG TPA: bifunctional 4-hydroxy-2-oxoglutarate aldolase/2-dehydro-3-deoxy-phosphogluconate aldolase [Fimbriiglobus sp.]|jgi:2-dehydro-3-deoxyphosphogluconate aldolase/(4S)-4-hydroxy-2-oxoglutarate aldolase
MTTRPETLSRILASGLVAVVRAPSPDGLVEVIRALADGGIAAAEVTLTVPNAFHVLRAAKAALGDRIVLGVGTVISAEDGQRAVDAGAEFLVAPTFNPEVVRLAQLLDVVVMPGAFTPTEILAAWNAGADVVKVFPAEVVGPAFFRAMRGPLPHVKLMPTGGVDLSTAAAFLKAGAVCLGVGSQLVDPALIRERAFERITDLARKYVRIVQESRTG